MYRMQWDLFSPVLHYRLEQVMATLPLYMSHLSFLCCVCVLFVQEIDSAFIGNTLDKELPQQLLKHLDNFDK